MNIAEHANQYNVKPCPFMRYDFIACEPDGKMHRHGASFTMRVRIRLQWWKPSYWAYLRGLNENKDPAWLAWLFAIWFAFRFGPFVKTVDQQ